MALEGEAPVSALEMAVIEQNAVALGVPVDTLMENAGRAVAEEATRHLPGAPARVAILAGTGNNGGDGTCAAHYLHQWGFAPEIFLVRSPNEIRSGPARRCFERAARSVPVHVGVPSPAALGGFSLLIDSLLGTGQVGAPRGAIRDVVAAARESGVPILAVDEPTGQGSVDALHPKWTVALEYPKIGTTPGTSGEVTVRPIGIPATARSATGPGEYLQYPVAGLDGRPRPGRVVVIGGGPFSGAPALAALAALRSGVERATVLAPLPAADRIQGFSPDLVVRPVGEDHLRPSDVPTIESFLRDATVDAVVLGMGAGRADATVEAMRTLVPKLRVRYPLVVDADGLAGLTAPLAEPPAGEPRVLATPNETEYRREFGADGLGSLDERLDDARRRATSRHVTLLVKGDPDLIAEAHRSVVNSHHPRALAVSGAGDVLGGVAGSLLARGLPPFAAARLASYWVGEAGYRAERRAGDGLVATDLLGELGPSLVAGLRKVGRDRSGGSS